MFLLLARAEPDQAGVSSLETSEELADQTAGSEIGLTPTSFPLTPHPMSLGTEGGKVSHRPWPEGLRASVSFEGQTSKEENEFELNKTGDREVQTT